MSTSIPHLPALQPSTAYSFYPYPIQSIPTTSLRGLAPPPTQSQAGPSSQTRAQIQQATRIRERAQRRALVGQRPAGFAVGRESEDLDLEEMAFDDERINGFGHRFLLPIGRRQTQMELDAAPSPTPSEPDNERRQEDMNLVSPNLRPVGANGQTDDPMNDEDEDEDMRDLDGDLEDLDGDVEDLDDVSVEEGNFVDGDSEEEI